MRGCTLSPMPFVRAIEPLSQAIRFLATVHNNTQDTLYKISLYAD